MKEETKTCIRLETKLYRDVRKLSYLHEKSINKIINCAVREYVEQNKKVLTNAEIVP